jgi:hypothetical protein
MRPTGIAAADVVNLYREVHRSAGFSGGLASAFGGVERLTACRMTPGRRILSVESEH